MSTFRYDVDIQKALEEVAVLPARHRSRPSGSTYTRSHV